MPYTEDDYTAQLQAHLPPGKAWPRDQNSDVTKVLKGLSPELARVQARAAALLSEFNPGEAVEMLPEHENVNGLPSTGTVSQRQNALITKLRDDAGHNPADYAAWALSKYGITATFRRQPLPPLRAGFRAGDRARDPEWGHAFMVEYMVDVLTPAANAFNSWSLISGTVTANAANGPDGTATADLISGATPFLNGALSNGNAVQVSMWLRAASSAPIATIACGSEILTVPLSTSWRRYVLRSSGGSLVALGFTGGTVHAWGAYAGLINSAFEDEFANVRQQSQSVPLYRVVGDWPED